MHHTTIYFHFHPWIFNQKWRSVDFNKLTRDFVRIKVRSLKWNNIFICRSIIYIMKIFKRYILWHIEFWSIFGSFMPWNIFIIQEEFIKILKILFFINLLYSFCEFGRISFHLRCTNFVVSKNVWRCLLNYKTYF